MNKTILSITIGVVFFLAFAHSNTNVCTISDNNLEPSQELVTISNHTDQCKFIPLNYYIRDTYRTRNLNTRSESRRIFENDREQERRLRLKFDDTRRVRLTRSPSLPNIRSERVRSVRDKDIDFRGVERRALERNGKMFMAYHSDERTFRRDVRDGRNARQMTRDNINDRKPTYTYTKQNDMVAVSDKDSSTEWPFSNFVQSAIGVLGLYYFGMHNKSTK